MKDWKTVLIVVLALTTLFLFFRQQKVSCFSPGATNTIFNMTEFDWIPSEVKMRLMSGINDVVVPAMRTATNNSWNNIPQNKKTEILNSIDKFFTDSASVIGTSDVRISIKSPAPPPPPA